LDILKPKAVFLKFGNMFPIKFQLSNLISAIFSSVAYLENIVGTFSAEVVLAWQDNHRLCKHLQADGTNQLFLQVIHGIHFRRALLAGRKTTTKPPQIKPHKLRNVRTKIHEISCRPESGKRL